MPKRGTFTTTDNNTRTFVNLLRRRAFMSGLRLVKARASGFKLVDVRDGDRIVLGADDAAGASATDVAKFLKVQNIAA